MKTSRDGIALIKRWEGCRLTSYPDPATGYEPWTIGYGTTTATGFARIVVGMKITQAQADEWLITGLAKYEAAVIKAIMRKPTQHQFDAMVSLCYNIGPTNFGKSSVVRHFNSGNTEGAAAAFMLWKKAGKPLKVMRGLTARRADESKLFLT